MPSRPRPDPVEIRPDFSQSCECVDGMTGDQNIDLYLVILRFEPDFPNSYVCTQGPKSQMRHSVGSNR